MAGPVAFLAPDPIQSTQFIPGGNTPASGGLLFVYSVGTSSKTNSYTDPSASTARTNPIVLDSGGNIPGNGEVWITSSAKFVLAPSNDTDPPTSPYWTRDNYRGINDITAAQVQSLSAQSEWVQGSTATFVGVTLFSLVGDQTTLYTLGRRVKATVTGGDRFGIVTSATLSGGSTAVGLTLDSSTLNGGLSSVSYGILSTPNGSVPWETQTTSGVNALGPINFFSVTVTSSANPNIWTGGNVINFTGTTTVSSFATAPQAGATRTLIISSSVTFATSAALFIGGGNATYAAAIGEKIDVVATSTGFSSIYPVATNISGGWVPAFTFGGATTGITYQSQSGFFRKAEHTVYADFDVTLTSTGTATGIIGMTGLPYPISFFSSPCVVRFFSLATSVVSMIVQGDNAGSTASLFHLFAPSPNYLGTSSVVFSNSTRVKGLLVFGTTA